MSRPFIPGTVPVDAHVHIHPQFDLPTLLDAAARNFRAAAAPAALQTDVPGYLLLTDTPQSEGFATLHPGAHLPGGWSLHETAEPEAVVARQSGIPRLILAAGRQLVTTDGLELLALLSPARFPAADLQASLVAAHEAGAIPVIPWGWGKWTLRRGAVVERLVSGAARPLFVGDNGGRLRAMRQPRLLATAHINGVFNLPGSDPLPFAEQQDRAGSSGFFADVDVDLERPAHALRTWLAALRHQPRVYLRGETPGRFVINQLRMQLRKRLPGG